MSLQKEVDQELETIISKTHRILASNFTFQSQTRDLDPRQNDLLQRLDKNSPKYRQLAGALAIDSYLGYLIALLSKCQPLLQITTVLFGDLTQVRRLCQQYRADDIEDQVGEVWINLCKLAEITHQLFPRSPLVAVHRSFMEGDESDPSETIYSRLYDENMELREQLEQNDKQVLDLELKLTKLLQEHDGCEGNVDSSLRMLELREQLNIKDEQIERMNEEFSFEIEKYNTVYEAMKREIQELKDYKQIDLVDMVQKLETQIVKLREEKERDEMIIRELRQRSSFTGSPYSRKPNSYSRLYS